MQLIGPLLLFTDLFRSSFCLIKVRISPKILTALECLRWIVVRLAQSAIKARFALGLIFYAHYCTLLHGQNCTENPLFCPWVLYLAQDVPLQEIFSHFNTCILDPDLYTEIPFALKQNKMAYAYLSLGSLASNKIEAKEQGLLLPEQIEGRYLIDIRNPDWVNKFLNECIPALILRGYQGIFIDHLEDSRDLEKTDPELYQGMHAAAIQLVQLIHVYFPAVRLMINCSYAFFPEIGASVHDLIASSLYTYYDNKKKIYVFTPSEEYQNQVRFLHSLEKQFPHLRIFSLDYWQAEDVDTIKKIYAKERENGFHPYVGTAHLDQIISIQSFQNSIGGNN